MGHQINKRRDRIMENFKVVKSNGAGMVVEASFVILGRSCVIREVVGKSSLRVARVALKQFAKQYVV